MGAVRSTCLVDELRMFGNPIVGGGGTPSLPVPVRAAQTDPT